MIEGLHEKGIFTQKLPFRLITNQNIDFFYPAHWHNAIEIVYVIQNDFIVDIGSKPYVIPEGSVFYIPGGELHDCKGVTETGKRFFINFDLSSLSPFEDLAPILCRLNDPILLTPADGALYTKAREQFNEILDESEPSNQLFYLARMIDMLLLLSKYSSMPEDPQTSPNAKRKAGGLDKINKSFEYIESNYADNISLKDIAHAVGFSEFYFSRLFKEITEKSFHQYLNEFRIKKARMLLMDSNCSVSQAAYSSGFNSITTFDRLFRKINGSSPQEFRKLKR